MREGSSNLAVRSSLRVCQDNFYYFNNTVYVLVYMLVICCVLKFRLYVYVCVFEKDFAYLSITLKYGSK